MALQLKNGTINIVSKKDSVSYSDIDVTCSLFHISRAPLAYRTCLPESFINIICIESRCSFDLAEYECLFCLMMFLINTNLEPHYGVESNIN